VTTDKSLQIIDSFWAETFGCSIEVLRRSGVDVVPRTKIRDRRDVFVLGAGQAYVVTAREDVFDDVRSAVTAPGLAQATLLEVSFWEGVLGSRIDQAVGPTWLAYADTSDFYPADTSSVAQLRPSDGYALGALKNACSKVDWESGNIDLVKQPTFGYYLGDSLVAVAGYEVWAGKIGHIGVVTHPQLRGKGFGKTTVSAAAEHGLKAGLVMQYQTMGSNQPSKGIARSLGFRRYGRTVSVRLKGR